LAGFSGSLAVELRLAREFDAIAGLHAAVAAFCKREALGDACVFALQLTVEELFTNLIKYSPGAGDAIDVALVRHLDRVVLRLSAPNVEAFDPAAIPAVDPDAPLAARRPGGLGLHLVRAYTERLEVDHREHTLHITATIQLEASHVRDAVE
jgi:serine/threonine-protein kinase RsbW